MFEKAVAQVLQTVLGQFIKGIDAESLKLSVWNGDIKLVKLELNTEAIDALGLPVAVLGGSVGEVRVEVPWRNLSTKPIVVTVQQLFVLLAPKDVGVWDREAEERRLLTAKREQLELWETMEREKGAWDSMGERMVNQLVQELLRKIVVRVTDVHVRLESGEGDWSVAAGVTLRQLSVSNLPPGTPSSGSKTKRPAESMVHKEISVGGLALYISPGARRSSAPSGSAAWEAMMLPTVRVEHAPSQVLQPLSVEVEAWLNPSASDFSAPQVELRVVLPRPVCVSIQQSQLVGVIALADDLGRTERVNRLRLFGRPEGPPSRVGVHGWWRYAKNATMVLRNSGIVRFSWAKLWERRQQRRDYVNWYVEWLDAKGVRQKELRGMLSGLEDVLEVDDVIIYRTLARTSVKAAATQQAEEKKKFRWPWEQPESGAVPLSDQEIQRLQTELDHSSGGGAPTSCPRGYVQLRVHGELGGLGLLLSSGADAPIAQLMLHAVSVGFSMRPTEGEIGTQLRVGALRMVDLETPWPQLRTLIASHEQHFSEAVTAREPTAQGFSFWGASNFLRGLQGESGSLPEEEAHRLPRGGTSGFLSFSLETEPADTSAALDLGLEIQPLSLLVNPRLIASILRFIQVPPAHWQANIGLEQAKQAVTDTIDQLQREATERLNGRALSIRLHAHAPSLLVLEQPPEVRTEIAAAWRAYERAQPAAPTGGSD